MTTNDTLELFLHMAWRLQQEHLRTDPELRELDSARQALWQDFVEKHRHNRPLRKQVLRLLDAQGALESGENRLCFLLGLQMGLELRDVHLLRDVREEDLTSL